eukprot:TRINITY_DN2302_c0_g1_i3.p1 TRINITY_DN2302_c0_g1~~TRINITY_DN2302_c0_g1_i3.p1  ORF type:complete len:510 (+),score=120.99 TRINITY_DN2302_c0_g1_i3:205-1734(+)
MCCEFQCKYYVMFVDKDRRIEFPQAQLTRSASAQDAKQAALTPPESDTPLSPKIAETPKVSDVVPAVESVMTSDGWESLAGKNDDEKAALQNYVQQSFRAEWKARDSQMKNLFNLLDLAPMITDGMEVVVKDSFTPCFQPQRNEHWNYNIYLFICWVIGVVVRYCFLFPIRLTIIFFGSVVFAIAYTSVSRFVKDPIRKGKLQRYWAKLFVSIIVTSWNGVVKYHGVVPKKDRNQIFVCNHTTVFDICILEQLSAYSIVGQKHTGFLGWLQDNPLSCLNCVWFERKDAKDRSRVSLVLKEHINEKSDTPLLVFPEGTCVNNEYCIMFKKGAFELGATICPIAIKYNLRYSDPFWNSREKSFLRHAFDLWTCWAVVCDVWYLQPQKQREDETPLEFANRVKAMIAKKAGLINVDWDGYLKYFTPSPKFLEDRQHEFAKSLETIMRKRHIRSLSTGPSISSFLHISTKIEKKNDQDEGERNNSMEEQLPENDQSDQSDQNEENEKEEKKDK